MKRFPRTGDVLNRGDAIATRRYRIPSNEKKAPISCLTHLLITFVLAL